MHSKKILLGVNILLTFLILWPVSDTVMTWSSGQGGPGPLQGEGVKENGTSHKPIGKTKKISDYQALIRQDIFRTTGQKVDAPAAVKEEKPVELTRLNLRLKGTVIRGRSKSFAVIQDGASRKEDIYHVNDKLQNATIAKILPDQVILNVNNRQEALLLFAAADRPGPAAGVAMQAAKPEGDPPAKAVTPFRRPRRPVGRALPYQR
ncbi:MAG: type II secretion system protein N [Thermodesulfobacteriota bacterium]